MRQAELRLKSAPIYDEVEYLVEKSNYIGTNINRLKEKDDSISKLNEFRSLLINVRELVHITNSVNLAPLIKHFVELGINPGGNDISLQSKPLNGRFVPWYELINFEREEWNAGISDESVYREPGNGQVGMTPGPAPTPTSRRTCINPTRSSRFTNYSLSIVLWSVARTFKVLGWLVVRI